MDVIQLPAKATRHIVHRVWAHPDGRHVVALTVGTPQVLAWWDVGAGRRVRAVRLPSAYVRNAAFSPDHAWCAVGRDVRAGPAFAAALPLPRATDFTAFAFAPDGRELFAVRYDRPGPIARWALGPAGPRRMPPLTGLGGTKFELAAAPDGRSLFVRAHDGLRRVALPGGEVVPPPAAWDADSWDSPVVSPDGATVAVTRYRGVHLFDAADAGPARAVLPGDGRTHAAFTPDSRRVVTEDWAGTAGVWDAQTGGCVARYDWHQAIGRLYCVAVAPDGLTAYAGGADGRIIRWDLPD